MNLYKVEGLLNFDLQVINAARVLAARPKSKVAQENIDVFRDAWINQVFYYIYQTNLNFLTITHRLGFVYVTSM